jgi:lysozyme
MDQLTAQLKRHEGFRSKPYLCSAGKLTIGYGRNLDDVGVSRSEAFELLRQDIARARWDVEKNIECANKLNIPRQDVLINMCFNLGIYNLLLFKKMIAALEKRDYDEAAKQMLNSRWAVQVGYRAVELAEQMRTGRYDV